MSNFKIMAEGWDRLANVDHMQAIGGTGNKFDFERNGLRYARNIADMLPVNHNPKVLEIGCGAGRIMKHLAYLCKEICGVDVSQNMLDLAPKYHDNMWTFLSKDSSLSMFSDSIFDFAYSIGCFIHTPPLVTGEYIEATRRVLKEGATFYFDCHALGDSALQDVNRCLHTPLESINSFRKGWSSTEIKFVSTRFICKFIK